MAVVLQYGCPVAGLQAPLPKDPRQAENPIGEFPIGENAVVTAHGLLVGISPGGLEQYFG
jgi:hypothetical protein